MFSGLTDFTACPARKKRTLVSDTRTKPYIQLKIITTTTIKVKAVEKKLKFTKDPNDPGVYRYVMSPEQYSSLNQKKVIKEAALRSGVSQGVMQACWDAAGGHHRH